MLPVSFEKHCSNCHDLKFEPQAPDKEIPHGNITLAKEYVIGTYAEFALRGNFIESDNFKNDASTFRKLINDKPKTKEEKKAALEWAEAKTKEIIDGRYGRGLCGECHQINDNVKTASWDIATVHVPKKWLPKSHFNHEPHKDRECTTCHNAKKSEKATDILLPSITTCQECHGGESTTSKVRSTCTECHGFHRADLVMPKEEM